MKNICVIGSLNMDLVVNVDTMPKPGQTIIGSNFKEVPGGKGANQAVAMARLNGNVSMIGKVGEDGFGQTLINSLKNDKVDTTYIQTSKGATGVALITVDKNAQLFGAFLGILVAVTGLFFLDHIIWGLGATDMLFPYCKDYLRILLLFAPASMLQTLFQNLTVTAGRPSLGLSLSVGAGIINIILDYLFMAVLGMGVMGAALGTGIGYVIPASIGILFFSGKNGTLSFVRPSLRLSVLAKSCANGSSEMVSQISSAVTTFFFNRAMLKMLGENGVAAITIIIYAQFLLTTLYIGFSMGVAPVISFNYGAGNLLRLKNICRICLRFIAVSSACIFLSSLLFGPRLVHLFAGSETLLYDIAAPGFVLFSFSFLFSGMNIFSSATFTALSNGRISALISFFRTFGLIMLCLLILPALIGVNGVWLAVPVAELLTFGVSAYFLHSCREKYSLGG